MGRNAACLPAVHSLAQRSRSQRRSDRLAEHPWRQPKWKSRLLVSQTVCCRDCQIRGLSEQLTCGATKKQDLAIVRIFLNTNLEMNTAGGVIQRIFKCFVKI